MTKTAPEAPVRRPPGWILVIDDCKDVRDAIAEFLTTSGYQVKASDGPGALGLVNAATVPPRLVLLDWMMPGVGGAELLERLRADPKTADAPVVVLTAAAGKVERELTGAAEGILRIVAKPVTGQDLLRVVRESSPRLRS